MIDEIYEVTKHEYNALISELYEDSYEKVINNHDDSCEVHFYSKDMQRHFAACIIQNDGPHYYIIELPRPEERGKSQIIRQVTLGDEESVNEFFNMLNQSRAGNKND